MAVDRSTIWPYDERGEPGRFYYSRYAHPAGAEAEARLGGLEGGDALLYSSGMGAETTAWSVSLGGSYNRARYSACVPGTGIVEGSKVDNVPTTTISGSFSGSGAAGYKDTGKVTSSATVTNDASYSGSGSFTASGVVVGGGTISESGNLHIDASGNDSEDASSDDLGGSNSGKVSGSTRWSYSGSGTYTDANAASWASRNFSRSSM